MMMKVIEKSHKDNKMILQRNFVMICFILNGKTNANTRSTAMKTTWLNDERIEKIKAMVDGGESLFDNSKSMTRKSSSK